MIEINIDDYNKNNTNNNINTNYQNYQVNKYKNINVNLFSEKNLCKSIKKDITTSLTLPVIVRKNVHKVIYDSYAKALPVIYCGTKVIYFKNNPSSNFNINNIAQSNIPLSKTQILTITQELPTELKKLKKSSSTST